MENGHKIIAKILRADKDTILNLEKKMENLTGKAGIINKIAEANESEMRKRLDILGIGRQVFAKEIYDALISKIEADDFYFFDFLGKPSYKKTEDCNRVLFEAKQIAGNPKGLFLKKEKAEEFLRNQPPKRVLEVLGYQTIGQMLASQDLYEVFSTLRFLEDGEWLNKVFFRQYESLTSQDFEHREIVTKALSANWVEATQGFIQKKYHNISHLKELGVVFVIPFSLGISGETIRMLTLVFHYFNEVIFYSNLFEQYAQKKDFGKNVVSLLRGDILDKRLPESNRAIWLIIQRYLAKEDEYDWRLFEPHVSPEVIHWQKAEELITKTAERNGNIASSISFWQDLDWVGHYFKDEVGAEVLVSFNLIDTIMSLVKEKEFIKYLYHQQEALWNKIFAEYLGQDRLEELIKENIIKGYIAL